MAATIVTSMIHWKREARFCTFRRLFFFSFPWFLPPNTLKLFFCCHFAKSFKILLVTIAGQLFYSLFFFSRNIRSNETRMKASLLLGSVLCLFCLSHVKAIETGKRDIKMGIFIPFTGSWPGGPKMASSILIAMDKVNNDTYWLQGHKLTYVLKDSRCEAKSALAILVDYYTVENPKVDVFIGPGCSVGCIPGAYIAAHWNIPMISWGCSASVLSDKTLYPDFVRTAGTYAGLGELLAAFLTQYKWDRIGIMASTQTVQSETGSTAKVTLEKDGKFLVPFFGSFDPGATDANKLKSMVRSMATKARGKACELRVN